MSISDKPFGTPFSKTATKILLCGAGELGKEVIIEAQRLGIETIAVDHYANAPAMQVAHRSHVISMLDGDALEAVIKQEQPDLIVPEVEAIATDRLLKLESEGYTVIPTAGAARVTMDREGIRHLAAVQLKLPTSRFLFADTLDELQAAVTEIGLPVIVKPVMSSSGKGQSMIKTAEDIQSAWDYSQAGGRAGQGRVIVESFVDFDFEITLLTVRTSTQTIFCDPIGHRQENGDYYLSWQPQAMSPLALQRSQEIAQSITEALGGRGVFGVELFIKGDEVIFSEVSPRPHDTGMVTLVSQNLSEFALHVRAILDLPIPTLVQRGPCASHVIMGEGHGDNIYFEGVHEALAIPNTELRLFGKPSVQGWRRLGVALAHGDTLNAAIETATAAASALKAIVK